VLEKFCVIVTFFPSFGGVPIAALLPQVFISQRALEKLIVDT
jgi:hypothetical protein